MTFSEPVSTIRPAPLARSRSTSLTFSPRAPKAPDHPGPRQDRAGALFRTSAPQILKVRALIEIGLTPENEERLGVTAAKPITPEPVSRM